MASHPRRRRRFPGRRIPPRGGLRHLGSPEALEPRQLLSGSPWATPEEQRAVAALASESGSDPPATSSAVSDALFGSGGVVTTFAKAVGGATPLVSLTTDAGGSTNIDGGSVTTSAAAGQVYNDPVALGAHTSLTATGGVVAFAESVGGAGFDLSVTGTTRAR